MHPTNKLKLESEDLNATLTKTLLCAVKSCQRYLYPPIRQCRSGHCLCFICCDIPKHVCPECGAPIIEARNKALEALSSKFLIICKYRNEGCPETIPIGCDMSIHEQQCEFRLYKCFAGKCTWSGPACNIFTHTESNHKERVFVGSEKVFKIKKLENRDDLDMTFLFSCNIGEFWVKFIYKKADTTFYGAVQYIGHIEKANDYKYCFEMKSFDSNSQRLFTYARRTHSDLSTFEMIFNSQDCFCIPISIAKYFAEKDALSVNLDIEYIGSNTNSNQK